MPPAGVETAIPASNRKQTRALYSATGIGLHRFIYGYIFILRPLLRGLREIHTTGNPTKKASCTRFLNIINAC